MVYVPRSFAVVVLSSNEVISALAFKIRQVCVRTRRLVLCFDCSAWTSLFMVSLQMSVKVLNRLSIS